MAFDVQNFERTNSGAADAPFIWSYKTADTAATVAADGYFNEVSEGFKLGDLMYIVDGTGNNLRTITSATGAAVVTTGGYVFTGQIQTADIDNNAVTADKLAAADAGSGLAGGAGAALSVNVDAVGIEINTDTLRMKDLGVTTSKVALAIPKTVTVAINASDFLGMYATPYLLVAAPGANKVHLVQDVVYEVDYGGTAFAAGGVVAVQYHTTANGLGTLASATTAAATFTGYVADSTVGAAGAMVSGASSATVNRGLYLSNQTAAFTTGNSLVRVHLTYSTVSTTI